MLTYPLPDNILAFTTSRQCVGGQPGVDARIVGIEEDGICIKPAQIVIPRQTHSVNAVCLETAADAYKNMLADGNGAPTHPGTSCSVDITPLLDGDDGNEAFPFEIPDTDAVFTSQRGICVAVKTADCIPVLLYDERQHIVAAIHAGWRGTVGRIVSRTIEAMQSRGEDLHAIIGPGISLAAFEVGDEVYEAFAAGGFPMDRLARRYEKWHIDLWDANRWLLEQHGVSKIHTAGICTHSHTDTFYSARVETIKTGRNINGIMMPL